MQLGAPSFVNKLGEANNLALLMHVINLLPNPVYIKDREHKWVEVNEAFCDLLGYSREELLGKSDYDFNPPEQAKVFWEKDNLVFSTKQENINIEETTNSMGGLRWVESRKSYFQTDDGAEYIVGVLNDITDMKAREEALLKAQEEAVAGEKAKSNFLAVMSHEIRTPMTGVMGMAQILRNTELTTRQMEMVKTLESSGDALLLIIDDILDFSSLESGKVELNHKSFNLHDMIEGLVMLMGVNAREKQLDLILSIDENLPKYVLGDEGRLRQILSNLIKNAIKFTETGYIYVKAFPEVTVNGTVVQFTVKDTGVGIPDDKIHTIFDKFSQADYSNTRIYGGTGLGLSISKSLAQLMGGTLTAKSKVGEGSKFYLSVNLPVDTSVEPDPVSLDVDMSLMDHKVLIVDDIYANYNNLSEMLKEMGLKADYAPSAPEAVKKLAMAYKMGAPYSLLIADYLMPKVDGLCLVTSLRSNPAFDRLHIIIASSMSDDEIKDTFLAQNVDDYFVKPVNSRLLKRAIKDLGQSSTGFAGQANVFAA